MIKPALLADWRHLAKRTKFADAVLICLPDALHEVSLRQVKDLDNTVHNTMTVLLRQLRRQQWPLPRRNTISCLKNPWQYASKVLHKIYVYRQLDVISLSPQVTRDGCRKIVASCKENNVMLAICHVLRYTPQAKKIKELIESGAVGEVVNIQLLEPVRSCLTSFTMCMHSMKKIMLLVDWILPFCAQLRARQLAQLEGVEFFAPHEILPRYRSPHFLDGKHEMHCRLFLWKSAALQPAKQGDTLSCVSIKKTGCHSSRDIIYF